MKLDSRWRLQCHINLLIQKLIAHHALLFIEIKKKPNNLPGSNVEISRGSFA